MATELVKQRSANVPLRLSSGRVSDGDRANYDRRRQWEGRNGLLLRFMYYPSMGLSITTYE